LHKISKVILFKAEIEETNLIIFPDDFGWLFSNKKQTWLRT